MNTKTLLQNFEVLSIAPGAISRLRELILNLAVTGKLSHNSDSWTLRTLGEIANIRTGKLDANASSPDGKYPFFTCAKDTLRISSFSYDTECVLLAGNGNFDVNYYFGKFDAYQRTYIIEAKNQDELFIPYLFRFMQGHSKKLLEQSIGGVIKYIKIGFLTDAPLRLPTYSEQKRIVAKVDELMALCDQLEQQQQQRDNLRTATRKSAIDAISTATTPEELEAAWKRINNNWEVIADTPESVDALRTAILDLSVHGQLVPHDYSDYSAQELVAKSIALAKKKSALDQHASEQVPFEIPSHWAWSTVAGMCDTQTGTTPKILNSDNDREKIQYVTAADMVKQRALENNFIPLDSARRSGRIASKDSVLFVGIGATIGKSCLIESSATFNQQIHAATPRNMSAKYLNMVLASGYFQKICRESTNATAIPILNKSKWEKIGVPIPPLSEQIRIVKKVNELFDLCDQLESELKSRSEAAEKFARSVVNAA